MMHFLFKPSLSYALAMSIIVTVSLWIDGLHLAAIIWLVVSSIIGGIVESFVTELGQ